MTMTTRVAIAGGPRTGKTTLATKVGELLGVTPRATDSLIGKLDWSSASLEVSTWFDAPGPWVIEGVSVPRALRKWLAAHPEGWPFDVVVWRDRPFEVTAPRSPRAFSTRAGTAGSRTGR